MPALSLLTLATLLPLSSSAAPSLVFDASSLTWEERTTAEALQGLVNRTGPNLYLHHGDRWEQKWLEVYQERNGLQYERLSGLRALLERYRDVAKGWVIYDPQVDGSRYVALTLAGLEDLLPVSAEVLAGRSPSLETGADWPGADFTSAPQEDLANWRRAAGPIVALDPGKGLWLQEGNDTPGNDWSFISAGPLSIDLGRYPILELDVPEVQGEGAGWGIKLTWDRDGDGQVMGGQDDLVPPFSKDPGIVRLNIAELAGICQRHTFAYIQLHVFGPGGKVLWRRVRFVAEGGDAPPAQPPKPLTDLGISVRHDLRGRFKDSLAAYDWALQELMPRCNRGFAHAVNGFVEGIQAGCGPMAGFDWPVTQRGFVFNLTCAPTVMGSYGGSKVGGSPEQAAMYKRILAALVPPAQITGYGEPEDVWCRLLSENGHYSFHAYYNWSFHNRVPPRPGPIRQKIRPAPEDARPEVGRYLVCFMTSEGDTMKGPLPFFYGSWFDPNRGKVPMNWGINPLMARQFPAMLQYFYNTATPADGFFAGTSGAGYCYPDFMPNLEQFAEHTRAACEAADINCIDLWGTHKPEVIRRYGEITKPLGLTINAGPARLGLLPDGTPLSFHELAYWQVPAVGQDNWVAAFEDPAKRAQAVQWLARRIEDIAARHYPPFIILVYGDLHSYALHPTLYREVAEALDPTRFQPARLDDAFAAMREWSSRRVLVGGANSLNERLSWAVLQGVPTRIPLVVTNGRAAPAQVEVQVQVGEAVSRVVANLAPGENRHLQDLTITAPAEGDLGGTVRLVTPENEETLAARVTVASGVADVQSAEFAGLWSAASLRHRSGALVEAQDALDGHAWASPDPGAPGEHIVFGPYAELPQGRYLVLFRARLAPETDVAIAEARVAQFDVFAGGYQGTARQVDVRELLVADFARAGQWQWFALEGDWPGPPSQMETRVLWHGTVRLEVDRILAFRVGR